MEIEMSNNKKWLEEMAEKENCGCVSVGGLIARELVSSARCPLYEISCQNRMKLSEGVCKGDYESCTIYKQKQEIKNGK